MEGSGRGDGTVNAPPLLYSLSAFAALNAYPPSNGALPRIPSRTRCRASYQSHQEGESNNKGILISKEEEMKGNERGDCI